MGTHGLMINVRKRTFENGPRHGKYRSPYILSLPPPSEFLLSQSLLTLAKDRVRNEEFRRKITTAVDTVQTLLKRNPGRLKGVFTHSLIKLRTAIRHLPEEEVDPNYYGILEDQMMENFDGLQIKIVEASAWESRTLKKVVNPPGTADIKVIANAEHNLVSILINDHRTNVEFMFWEAVLMRSRLAKAIVTLDQVAIPEHIKSSIRTSLEKVIHCFSLEASIPYKLKDNFDELIEQLDAPDPLSPQFLATVKLMKAKAANCLKDSEKEAKDRLRVLQHLDAAFESTDRILAECRNPYWMMDTPDFFDHRKRPIKMERSPNSENLQRRYQHTGEDKTSGCICFRGRTDKTTSREPPLCPELLTYTEEIRKKLEIPPFRKDGKCHCDWLERAPACIKPGGLNTSTRLYTTYIKNIAKSRDVVKDVTCTHMQLLRIFGHAKRTSLSSEMRLVPNNPSYQRTTILKVEK